MLNWETELGLGLEDFLAELVVVFVCCNGFVLSLLQSLFVDDFLGRFLLGLCCRLGGFSLVSGDTPDVLKLNVPAGAAEGAYTVVVEASSSWKDYTYTLTIRNGNVSGGKCYRKRGEN